MATPRSSPRILARATNAQAEANEQQAHAEEEAVQDETMEDETKQEENMEPEDGTMQDEPIDRSCRRSPRNLASTRAHDMAVRIASSSPARVKPASAQ